jgi:DNA-binding NarL/FixJ family response regulator
LARFYQAGDRWGVADTLTSLADVASEQGDTTDAKRLLDESLSIHREIGSPGVAFVLSRLGWLARRSSDPVGAVRLFDEGLARARVNGEARNVVQVMLGLGAVSFDLGALDEAHRRVAEALRLAFDIGDHLAIVACLRWFAIVLGERDWPEHASRLLGAAAALRTRLGVSIWPSARIDEEVCVAGLVAQLGETAHAASWEEGATLPLTEVIESALAGAMVRPAQDASTALSPVLAMLTPRERTVLRLLAEGLSDKEIAEALEPKVSVRTAQSHVSSVLHKLGVETRKAARARAKAENIGTSLPFTP